MSPVRNLIAGLRTLFRKNQGEREMNEKLHGYLDVAVKEKLRSGISLEEARRTARAEMGSIESVKQGIRAVGWESSVESLWQDLRYGLRQLRRNPGFTIVAVLTLALGIGANAAIFSVVDAALLRPLPYQDPERLVVVWNQLRRLGLNTFPATFADYYDYQSQNKVFQDIAAGERSYLDLNAGNEPERVAAMSVSANLFPLLGVRAHLGRTFVSEENQVGRNGVVLLSDSLWRGRFGQDPRIIGQTLSLDNRPFTVIGVLPRSFLFTLGNSPSPDVWLPLALSPDATRTLGALALLARLKPNVSTAEALTAMKTIANRLEQEYHLYRGPHGEDAGYDVTVIPLRQQLFGDMRQGLLLLLGAVGFVLLIACANVANLHMAKATTRQKEMALRAALGASRLRLIRQLLTEGIALALVSGALGILLARWGVRIFARLAPGEAPPIVHLGIGGSILEFTLLVSVVTGIAFALWPALSSSRADLSEAVKESGKASVIGRSGNRLRQLLVVGEIALSLVVVIGAGLLIKSFVRLMSVKPGFNAESLVTARISLPQSDYGRNDQVAAFYSRLVGRIEALPGVKSASCVSTLPLTMGAGRDPFSIEGRPWRPSGANRTPQVANFQVIAPNYFRTLQIPLLGGRDFTAEDAEGGRPVAIINRTLARGFWPNEDPIGKHLMMGAPRPGAPWLTIIGVVGDVRNTSLNAAPLPQIYDPQLQAPARSMTLVVRSSLQGMSAVPDVRREVLALDPKLPIYDAASMTQVLSDSVTGPRGNMLMLTLFAGLALVLAAVGIYGVISYSVSHRTREIGLRIALGAQKRDVLRLVVGQGMVLATIGVATGVVAAFGVTRLMASLLYDVKPADPLTFVAVSAILLAVALLACWIPARRAIKVDPMAALRYE